METAVQFLCARYPHYFYLKGQFLVNRILDTKHNLATAEPLHVLLDNVPEDFAIMLRDEQTGRYMLRAGVVCSSIDWNLGEKIGLGLAAIHGPVPDYKENMQLSIDRYVICICFAKSGILMEWRLTSSDSSPKCLHPAQSNVVPGHSKSKNLSISPPLTPFSLTARPKARNLSQKIFTSV